MNKYDEMWSAIRHSPFMGVYISELYWLASETERACAGIFEDVPPAASRGDGYIKVDHSLHRRIVGALLSASRLRALVRNRRRRDGSRGEKEFLGRRASAIQEILRGIDLAPILDAKARNSIEHFDEYLDGTAIQSYRGSIPHPTLFPVDMVLSTRRLLEQFDVGGTRPHIYPIRAYIADERVFSNCGLEIQLEPLRDCCHLISTRVEPMLPDFAVEDRGAPMLVVTDASFPLPEEE